MGVALNKLLASCSAARGRYIPREDAERAIVRNGVAQKQVRPHSTNRYHTGPTTTCPRQQNGKRTLSTPGCNVRVRLL